MSCRSCAFPFVHLKHVPSGPANGLVVAFAVKPFRQQRLGVNRRGDIFDLVFRGCRSDDGFASRGGSFRLALPLSGRRAKLRGEGGTEGRHGVHSRGGLESTNASPEAVECARETRTTGFILSGNASLKEAKCDQWIPELVNRSRP